MTSPISRRMAVQSGLAASIGLWVSGFATVITGSGVHLLVTGDDEWQCVVLTVRRARIVIMLGSPQEWPGDSLALMLGTFRQRIDVLIAPSDTLALIPKPVPEGMSQMRRIALGVEHSSAATGDLDLRINTVEVRIRNPAKSSWRRSAAAQPVDERSSVEVAYGDQLVAMASSFEALAQLPAPGVCLLIAPTGDPIPAMHVHTGASTVASPRVVEEFGINGKSFAAPTGRYIVRTFPQDVAHFTVSESSISLPGWAQDVSTLT